MNVFRIVSTPKGEAPEGVRKEWVGVILPLKELHLPTKEGCSHEHSFSGECQPARFFVTVSIKTALDILEKKSPKAARWFHEHLSEAYLAYNDFSFGVNEVEITYHR